jgi:hypothetical protein
MLCYRKIKELGTIICFLALELKKVFFSSVIIQHATKVNLASQLLFERLCFLLKKGLSNFALGKREEHTGRKHC